MPDLDLNKLMEMAQNAQNELQKATQSLEQIEVEGLAGGGLVKVRATAKGTILGVSIDESLLQPSEKSMVEDLIAARQRLPDQLVPLIEHDGPDRKPAARALLVIGIAGSPALGAGPQRRRSGHRV